MIKTIRFKTDIINANDVDGKVLDRVCTALVLGKEKKNNEAVLKYKKYKSLNITHIHKISGESAGFL